MKPLLYLSILFEPYLYYINNSYIQHFIIKIFSICLPIGFPIFIKYYIQFIYFMYSSFISFFIFHIVIIIVDWIEIEHVILCSPAVVFHAVFKIKMEKKSEQRNPNLLNEITFNWDVFVFERLSTFCNNLNVKSLVFLNCKCVPKSPGEKNIN